MAKGGLVAFFPDEHSLLDAAHKVRAAGFEKFDSYTPFPIHGMDQAIGLKPSKLPYVTFVAGLTGCLAGLGLQTYINVYDWPINIGGKPQFSLPAFVPIIFELTILFGALATVGAMIAFCGLPKANPPIIDPGITDDKFALFIPEDDRGYDIAKIDSLFKDLGAVEVRKVAEL